MVRFLISPQAYRTQTAGVSDRESFFFIFYIRISLPNNTAVLEESDVFLDFFVKMMTGHYLFTWSRNSAENTKSMWFLWPHAVISGGVVAILRQGIEIITLCS